MDKKKTVVSLGHEALGYNTLEQMDAVKITASALADLACQDRQLTITHSNGPQVSMIHKAMTELRRVYIDYTPAPMCVCSAMSQGYIGYDLQNSLHSELLNRGDATPVVTLLTQVTVDPYDEAFYEPQKLIGRNMSAEDAEVEIKKGNFVKEIPGNGFRRIIAAPKPLRIVEIESIRTLAEAGENIIACGGGGSIDTAKSINMLRFNEGSVTDYADPSKEMKYSPGLISIPTTSGTGSEVSDGMVISDKDHNKMPMLAINAMSEYAVLDPECMVGMPRKLTIATGLDAAPMLRMLTDDAMARFPGLQGRVYPVVNRFFGEQIVVSGLITGQDLIGSLRGQELGQRLLLPDNMLRYHENVFLDDVTIEQVEDALGVPLTFVPQDGFQLCDAMLGLPLEQSHASPAEDPEETEYHRYNPSR